MASSITNDPLYEAQHQTALDLLGLYNPDQEAQRYKKSLGQLQQTIAERESRSGLTGSSEEKDALTNAANNFELGWAERQPDQLSKAISGSQLPITNLLNQQKTDQQQSILDWAKTTGLAGGAASLASWLLGNGGAVSGLSQLTSAGKSIYDFFKGSGMGDSLNLSDPTTIDWLNNLSVGTNDYGINYSDIPSNVYDWWTWS